MYYSITTNTNIKFNHYKLWNCQGPLPVAPSRHETQQPPYRYATVCRSVPEMIKVENNQKSR